MSLKCMQGPAEVTSRFFAESLVRTHLNGRVLAAPALEDAITFADERLADGLQPVLDARLREFIDRHAVARDPAAQPLAAPNEKSLAGYERLAAFWRGRLI